MMARVLSSLSPTWESQMEFLAPVCPSLTVVVVGIWEINQQIEGLSLSLSLCCLLKKSFLLLKRR